MKKSYQTPIVETLAYTTQMLATSMGKESSGADDVVLVKSDEWDD